MLPGAARRARDRAAGPRRPQRRRLDRAHPRERAPGQRPRAARAARVRGGCVAWPASRRRARRSRPPTWASAWAATTATPRPRSGSGTTSGSRRSSATGTSRTCSRGVTAPTLLIQGEHDQYGTLAQIDAIERGVRGPVQRAVLDCRHAPHLEAPEETLAAAVEFLRERPRAPLRRPVRAQLRRRLRARVPRAHARARDRPARAARRGRHRAAAASTRRSPSRWPPPGTAVEVVPQGLIPSGLSNSTHVIGEARDGVMEAIARCRARGEGEWLWDVEIGPPGGAATAVATVTIAVREKRV